jgi:hypothetical protein
MITFLPCGRHSACPLGIKQLLMNGDILDT